MILLIKAAQLVLALVILVTIHEFGHYFFARIFGVKVEKFYLFFNPWFSLLRCNPREGTLEVVAWNKKDGTQQALKTFRVGKPVPVEDPNKPTWRDTIYGLGWLPLGGYCAIAGMVDETHGAYSVSQEPKNWEFESKPAWKRLCVMVAGVVFNFILAIGIYIGIAIHWGDSVIPFQNMREGMDFSPELQEAGFRNGDILQSLNDKPMDAKDYEMAWDMVQPGARVGVLRNGRPVEITITDGLLKSIATKGKDYAPMTMRFPVVVAKAMPGEGAALAGLQKGDRILTVASDTTPAYTEFLPALMARKDSTVAMLIERNGETILKDVAVNENGKIGIQMVSPIEIFDIETVNYNFFQAIPRGWQIGTGRLSSYVGSLGLVFTKEGAQSLGGFGTLGDLFPDAWNWYSFWQITAFLSIILAFMNIIPIPGLDGGHTLFLLVEMISRRKPSPKFLEVANTIGFAFLFLLLIYANGNDIYRLLLK